MTTQHSVNETWSSKTGVNVMPRLTVFQSPPNALATYHTLGFFGSIAMSATRPEDNVGPMPRSSMPFSASAVDVLAPWPCTPTTKPVTARTITSAVRRILFMLITPQELLNRERIPAGPGEPGGRGGGIVASAWCRIRWGRWAVPPLAE